MEALGPACECLKCLWPPLARRISYIKDLKKNFKKLKNEVEDLCSRKEDINREICRDISKMPSTECQDWLTKLEQLVSQVKDIEQKINANRRCSHVCCFPDIFSRKKLGKQVMSMLIDDVTRLKEASVSKGGAVVVDAPLQVVERVPAPNTEGQTSTDRLVQQILTWIRDDKIQKIGLWGMGGVGKTTIMKILNNESELEVAFDIVIWVTVSKDLSITVVQNQILQRLGLKRMDNELDDSIARKLLRVLETKKYLLLLDDIWGDINLEDVGIPIPNKRIGSKIVLTTRKYLVCKQMGTDQDIKVVALSKEEAWRLFREKVGGIIDSPNIEPIAREVVEECDGLPLAIIVIGGSMRKVKEVHAWRNALEELRSASFEIGDMEDMVFKRLKFSYDRLKNENTKNCFLYCALYPEDCLIPVDELVKHWRDEGFIKGVQSLDKAYDKACTILDGLVDDSLLERVNDYYIKMHDVMRDLALQITSPNGEGPRFLVRAGVGIEEWENTGEWEEAERISLMRNRLSRLPASPICNSLCTLLLQVNGCLEMLPEFFFQHMQSLRVLNLCFTKISVLPPSVSSLANLRALYIRYGEYIESVPSEIGCLKRLEVLYIGHVTSLPIEVRELTSLRSMRMGFAGDAGQAMRVMCCDGVISSLHLLEDLRFYFITDSLLEQWHEIINVGVGEEVGSLKHLTSLIFEFSTTECLDHFVKKRRTMNCPKLTKFFLSVKGDVAELKYEREVMGKELKWYWGETIKSSGMVEVLSQAFEFSLVGHKTVEKLSDFGNAIVLPNLQKCPKMKSIWDDSIPPPPSFPALTYLWIDGCGNLRSVFTWGTIQHMPNLEELFVNECENMEEVVAVREAEDQVVDDDDDVTKCLAMETSVSVEDGGSDSTIGNAMVLPNLQKLNLRKCPKMRSIWDDSIPPPLSFPALTDLHIYRCGNLRSVFTRGTIQHMLNLEKLSVDNCENMEEIVAVREAEDQVVDDDDVLFFPRLKELKLDNMDKLVRIWKGVSSQPWPSLEEVRVWNCPNLKTLNLKLPANDHHNASSSSSSSSSSTLRKIAGQREWWGKALEWEHSDDRRLLQPLFKKLYR